MTNFCVLPAGSIPSWLQGTLLRNGPGLFSVGNSEYNHWFDGLSLIHSFTFRNGEKSWIADNNQMFCFVWVVFFLSLCHCCR